jgi:hypothetical protein
LRGRSDLLRLVGEGGGVQLECRFDQRDELCGWGQHLPVDLADGVRDGQVGQVHGDQVHRFADEVRAAPGHVQEVRRLVFDPLTKTQSRQLREIGRRITRAIDPTTTAATSSLPAAMPVQARR